MPLAPLGSVLLALGAALQHRGVRCGARPAGTSRTGRLLALMGGWFFGTLLLAAAIPFQLLSLFLAQPPGAATRCSRSVQPLGAATRCSRPVQPLDAAALVISALLNTSAAGARFDGRLASAVTLCALGVGLFVAVAAPTTTSLPVRDAQLIAVLGVLAGVLAVLVPVAVLVRRRLSPIALVIGAGVLFGFVGSLTKVVLDRVHRVRLLGSGLTSTDRLTGACVLGTGAAGALGAVLVHASGPPHLVVAGLTVVDPVVGVTLGVVVLGEAAGAPPWAPVVFLLTGAVAVAGVVGIARHSAEHAPVGDRAG